jgi:sugar phosphate isomerase/epimerase
MKIGYNTNGLAHHRLDDAIRLLADNGFKAIAITPDVNCLDPAWTPVRIREQLGKTLKLLEKFNMACVVETGARFVLNPRIKHHPTLMDAEASNRSRRIDFLKNQFFLAARLNATCLSFWSGRLDENITQQEADERLVAGIREVLPLAEKHKIPIAFEPEPGMYIQTMDDFQRIDQLIQNDWFQLTIDIGHLHCLGEVPIENAIRKWQDRLINIHIEDMKPGIHEHLMFGEGTIDFPPIFQALHEIQFQHPICVELSRDSHRADQIVPRASEFLRQQIATAG